MAASLNGVHRGVVDAYEYACDWFQWLTGGTIDARGRWNGGIRPTLTSGFRSAAEQVSLYENRARNPYPVNRPGDSAHEYGLAIDSWVPDQTVTVDGYRWNSWALWTAVREAVGFRVPSNDRVHSEVPNWRDLVA